MLIDCRLRLAEELGHVILRQPDRFLFQPHINFDSSPGLLDEFFRIGDGQFTRDQFGEESVAGAREGSNLLSIDSYIFV